MKSLSRIAIAVPAMLCAAGMWSTPARAQAPEVVAPIVINTAAPIVIGAVKPKNTGLGKFEGYVMNANTAEITLRGKGNDLSIQTFSLSQNMTAKMQTIVDKGGYQYGDKVTVFYDPSTKQAVKIKGKASKAK